MYKDKTPKIINKIVNVANIENIILTQPGVGL